MVVSRGGVVVIRGIRGGVGRVGGCVGSVWEAAWAGVRRSSVGEGLGGWQHERACVLLTGPRQAPAAVPRIACRHCVVRTVVRALGTFDRASDGAQ